MEPKLNCATSTIKYILFFFNFIFLIGGVAILVIGTIIVIDLGTYDTFFSDAFAAPGILLITTGAIVVVTGFLGCCGAIRQSYWMLLAFSCCMTIIFILQLVGGILAFVFQSELDVILRNELEDQMRLYDDPEYEVVKTSWDQMQKEFQCCGVDSYSDWLPIGGLEETPASCQCPLIETDICNPLGWYKKGCYFALKDYFTSIQTALGSIAIVFAVIELIGIAFALIVAFSIKNRDLPVYVARGSYAGSAHSNSRYN